MESKYYNKAYGNISENGVLWDHPPTVVIKTVSRLEICWLDFFKMRVFNWIPEAIIGKERHPYCPNCGKTLQKNGHDNPPLVVFDQCDNYWLNSSNKYICRNCEDYSKFCDKADDKRVYNFTSSSSEIL